MLEVEIKSACKDPEAVRRKIADAGGNLKSEGFEHDVYYRHPCRDFSKTDEAFRIRYASDGSYITYKGPKIGDKSKTRFEMETKLFSAEDMKVIIEKLGFSAAGEVKKKREIYQVEDLSVCIDNVDGLGNFVEIETISDNKDEAEKKLFDLAEKLGLSLFERRSYLELLLKEKNV